MDAAPEVMDDDDDAAVLTWLTPRTEGNPVARVASEVVEIVDVAVVVGVSELVDEVIAGYIVDDVDDDEVDESADELLDEGVVTDETSGIPIFAVTAVNPATDVAPGTEALEVSSLS